MRLRSTVTVALALALGGTAAFTASPALAKEKKEEAAKLSPSAGFRPAAVEIQKLLEAKDFAGAKAKAEAGAATATTPDDKFFLGNFFLSSGIGLKEEATQRKGLELMLDSGKAPAADAAKFHFYVGQFALQAKDTDKALEHLNAAAAGGYEPATAEALIAQTYFTKAYDNVQGSQFTPTGKQLAQQGLPHLRKAIDAETAAGRAAAPDWYARGFKIAALSHSPDLPAWTKLALQRDNNPENWRIALRTLQDGNPGMSRDENLDILRLMFVTNSLSGDYSYGEYIDAASKGGLLGEVKSVIDAGRANSQLPANRYADVYSSTQAQLAKDKASLPASAAAAEKAATGRVAAATASAYMGYGDNAKAVQLYRLALSKGGVDPNEVNTRLGIALARSGDTTGAKAAFAAVAATPPLRRQIADFWTMWLDRPATAAPAAAPAT